MPVSGVLKKMRRKYFIFLGRIEKEGICFCLVFFYY